MIANYQQPGSAIDYPNGTSSAIAAGQVVSLTTRIGVAGTDIPASAVGSLYVKGVFAMPKAASTAPQSASVSPTSPPCAGTSTSMLPSTSPAARP